MKATNSDKYFKIYSLTGVGSVLFTILSLCLSVQGFSCLEVDFVDTRIAVVSIIVENPDSVEKLNNILHEYGKYVIGRMGIPYHKRNISIISVVMDAPGDVISALSGKLGMVPNVSAKTVYSKLPSADEGKGMD